jgi:hypothetical protein
MMNGFYIQCCNNPSFQFYWPLAAQQDIAGQLHLAVVLR